MPLQSVSGAGAPDIMSAMTATTDRNLSGRPRTATLSSQQQAPSGWTGGTLAPRLAGSSPAQIGYILNDPKLATAGHEANTFNTAPPEVQRQITAAREQAQSQVAQAAQSATNTGNRPVNPGADAGNRNAAGQITTADGRPMLNSTSSIGWLNWLAQNPVTADQLLVSQSGVMDPKLATGTHASPMTGIRSTPVQISTFNTTGGQNPNIPAEVTNAINSLNMNQSLRRAQQAELVDTLFRNAASNPVYAEAFRAAVVQPGASVGFGSRILSGAEMAANVTGAQAAARNISARTNAITSWAAGDPRTRQLEELRKQRAQAGQNPMGFYTGSTQERLDKQIMDLQSDMRNNKTSGNLAIAAAGAPSGWVPIR